MRYVFRTGNFTLNEETEITTIDGRRVRCTLTFHNGVLKLKEIPINGGHTSIITCTIATNGRLESVRPYPHPS